MSADARATILVAEDDPDDRYLIARAFAEARPGVDVRFVSDGEELMDFLCRRGRFADAPRPGLILLDLNMPRKDGWECLGEIQADPELGLLRVVVLTTSVATGDVAAAYAAGAVSYISKPVSFAGLVEVAKTTARYWLDVVQLPPG